MSLESSAQPGQSQVPDDDAADHDRVVRVVLGVDGRGAVREQRAGTLPDHFRQRLGGVLEVVRGVRVGQGDPGRDIFEIGQPDVHKAFKRLNGFHALIGAGIVDDRDRKTLSFCFFYGRNDDVEVVGSRDQVDVLGVLLLQLQEDLGEPGRLDLGPVHGLRDRVILAVYAAHIAAGEENGAASPRCPEITGSSSK